MEKNSKVGIFNFGKSWFIIIFCIIAFWLHGGMVNDSSTNIIIPALAEKMGLPLGTMLSFMTVASFIGAAFLLLMGVVNRKIGPRYTMFICLIVLCIGHLGLGMSTSFGMYVVFLTLQNIGGPSAVFIAAASLVAQWFPKKSGVVMGYTTMGLNFSSMLYIPMSTALVNRFGVSRGVILPVIICFALAIVGLIFLRDTPFMRGLFPDNVTEDVYKKEYFNEEKKEDDWKLTKMLKKGVFWQVAVGSTLLQMVTAIVISQLVNRGMEVGFSQAAAVTAISICSIIGFIGSWLVGVVDTKIGTKKAMYLLAIWYIIALLLNFSGNTICMYIFYAMYGIALGGSANFLASLPINVFGRQLFTKLNIIICPIQFALASVGVMINGIFLNATGSVRGSYIVGVIICVISIIIIATVKEHKYNPDFMDQKEAESFMQSLK